MTLEVFSVHFETCTPESNQIFYIGYQTKKRETKQLPVFGKE